MKREVSNGIIIGMVIMTCISVLAWVFSVKYDEWYTSRYCYYISAEVVKTDGETTVFEDNFGYLWMMNAGPQYIIGREVILFVDTKRNNDVTDNEISQIITYN